uniref:Uncharacterized protein n=1 Tax=Arundo donax TaxID=35708 RepID=A0A0A9A8N4_ARUDO
MNKHNGITLAGEHHIPKILKAIQFFRCEQLWLCSNPSIYYIVD